MRDKLAQEQRKLSRKKKRSSNWHKQCTRVAKIQEKVANQRKNFLHHKSRELVTTYDAVIIEDIDMKGMSQALMGIVLSIQCIMKATTSVVSKCRFH